MLDIKLKALLPETCILLFVLLWLHAFSALMRLVGQQEGHPAWVVGCWHAYVSGSRCRFAYGPADATATYYLFLQHFVLHIYLQTSPQKLKKNLTHGESMLLHYMQPWVRLFLMLNKNGHSCEVACSVSDEVKKKLPLGCAKSLLLICVTGTIEPLQCCVVHWC